MPRYIDEYEDEDEWLRSLFDILRVDNQPTVSNQSDEQQSGLNKKMGRWIKRMEEKENRLYKAFIPVWSCSECGKDYDPAVCQMVDTCPNCGAKMTN